MLAASWHLMKEWDLKPLSLYGLFAGLAAGVIGVQFFRLGLSKAPVLAGTGFLLAGLAGIGAYSAVKFKSRTLRVSGAVVLMASGLIWAYLGYSAFWSHMAGFMNR